MNELEKREKEHKKKSKGRGWHMSVNAGDVEKGIEIFNNSTSLGGQSTMAESYKEEKVELYYPQLEVERIREIIPATYWEPSEVDTYEDTVEYEYEVDMNEVVEALGELITSEDYDKFDTASDEEFFGFIEDNFDSLFDKYEKEILHHFEDAAREEWEERKQYSDYEDNQGPDPDRWYDEYRDSKYESLEEALDKKRYVYEGPIYYDGRRERENTKIYTMAESPSKAISNIIWKLCLGDRQRFYRYDLDNSKLICLEKKEEPKVNPEVDDEPHICAKCGFRLNDAGECPACDLGEEDLYESLTTLEALWNLNRDNF